MNLSNSKLIVPGLSCVVFRLDKQWLALPVSCVKELIEERSIHPVPKRSNSVILGLVNVNGKLEIIVSLKKLLYPKFNGEANNTSSSSHFLVLSLESGYWIFAIDECEGVFRIDSTKMIKTAVDTTLPLPNYVKGCCRIDEKEIHLLDEILLNSAFLRFVQ